jgi:molecular chaperone GrpE (heat shock protein)
MSEPMTTPEQAAKEATAEILQSSFINPDSYEEITRRTILKHFAPLLAERDQRIAELERSVSAWKETDERHAAELAELKQKVGGA